MLENTFSPVNALFSALATWGIVITLYWQSKQFFVQKFENYFFQLLQLHHDNSKSLPPPELAQEYRDMHSFEAHYKLLKLIVEYYLENGQLGIDREFFPVNIQRKIEDEYTLLLDESGNISFQNPEIFKAAYVVFDDLTSAAFWHYNRTLYHLIKYAHENAPNARVRKNCMRIIRSQFSTYSHVLLYYNALMSQDSSENEPGKSKYQVLIEENELLHHLQKRLLLDSGAAGKYDEKAFGSPY